MSTVKQIQEALIAKGYSVGAAGADGVKGRDTIAAIKKFQKDKGLDVDGIVGPQTGKALFPSAPTAETSESPPWYVELARKMRMRETDPELKKWLKSDDHTLGDPAELPWCGDAVETAIALTLPDEVLPTNPYYALNWAKFGIGLAEPAVGAVLAFKRPGGGHVGFYVGEDDSAYHVLGGNQSDRVSVCRVGKDRFVAARWPKTVPLPATGRVRRSPGDLTLSTNEF